MEMHEAEKMLLDSRKPEDEPTIKLSFEPGEGLTFLAELGSPRISTQTLVVNISDNQPISWTASTETTPTLAIDLSPVTGGPGSAVSVSVDSAGHALGSHTSNERRGPSS